MSDDVISLDAARERRRGATAKEGKRLSMGMHGDLIFIRPGDEFDWQWNLTEEHAESFGRYLLGAASKLRRKRWVAEGGCTRCWGKPCRCPPEPVVHWPAEWGLRCGTRARDPRVATTPGQVTCKSCLRRMPKAVK